MMEEKLEQELGAFDFSLCHPLRESLLDKLLTMHRQDRPAGTLQHCSRWAAARLEEEELDWVAAAGTGAAQGMNLPKQEEEWKTNH